MLQKSQLCTIERYTELFWILSKLQMLSIRKGFHMCGGIKHNLKWDQQTSRCDVAR